MKSRSIITITMITALCVLLSLMCIMPVIRAYSAPAADPGVILIKARAGGSDIGGMNWRVYLIGERDERGYLSFSDSFADCGIVVDELTDDNIKEATTQLSAYISDNQIEADYQCVTNDDGEARIEGAAEGVYFIESDQVNIDHNIYTPSPALAEMKSGEGLSVLPKIESRPEDSHTESGGDNDSSRGDIETDSDGDNSSQGDSRIDTDSDSDTDSNSYTDSVPSSSDSSVKDSSGSGSGSSGSSSGTTSQNVTTGGSGGSSGLPQTGQLWWPVPILSIGGLVLIALGMRVSAKGKDNE